jgi:hypothetical protein
MEDIEPSDRGLWGEWRLHVKKQPGAVNGAVYRQSSELLVREGDSHGDSAREWRMENGEWRVQNSPPSEKFQGGGAGSSYWARGDLLYSWRSILHSPFSILYGNSLSSQLQSRSGVENSDWRMENFRMEIYSLLRHE